MQPFAAVVIDLFFSIAADLAQSLIWIFSRLESFQMPVSMVKYPTTWQDMLKCHLSGLRNIKMII